MDNFKVIYRILRYLETCMDFAEPDLEPISAAALGITKERWAEIMAMLSDNGYVSGITAKRYMRSPIVISGLSNIRITLKGLEYLQENSLMQKAAELAKGAMDITTKLL